MYTYIHIHIYIHTHDIYIDVAYAICIYIRAYVHTYIHTFAYRCAHIYVYDIPIWLMLMQSFAPCTLLQVVFYKRLHEVIFVESIPKSPSGKILRKELRSRLEETTAN